MFYLLGALKKYLMKQKLLVFIVILAIMFELAFEYFTSMSMKYLIDFAIEPQNITMFFIILVIFVAGGLISLVVGVAGDYSLARLSEKSMVNIRSDMYARFQQLSSRAFSKYRSGDLLARFTLDMPAVEYALQQVFVVGLYSITSVIIGVALMFSISWKLMLVAIGGSLLVMLPQLILNKRAKNYNQNYVDVMEQLSNTVEEEVNGYRTVQVLNLKSAFQKRFRKQMDQLFLFGVKRSFVNSNLERLPVMVLTLVNVAVLAIGGYFTFQKEMTIGDYTAFNSVFITFNFAITSFMQIMPIFIEGEVGMRRIKEIEELEAELVDREDAKSLEGQELAVRYNGVSFSYNDDEPVLTNINLHIPPKQYVAIVGSSGSGKSTLIQLLLRFYKVEQGNIVVGNYELQDISLDSLFQSIGVVFQEPYLFNTSIRENLLLAAEGATEEQLRSALEMAGLLETIDSMPLGLDTPLVNQGQNLSTGEKQRLAIAQAILHNPQIFIADDISATLDIEAEEVINRCLARLRQGRTLVHITHRLTSVTEADLIYVLDQGKIVASGTHEELLSTSSYYDQLWRRQQGFQWSSDRMSVRITGERLSQLPFFANVDMDVLQSLADTFITERRSKGDIVIRQGEQGNKFYIIVRGHVAIVKRDGHGLEKTVAHLQDGQYFGEIALLRNIPRTADVRAVSDSVFLTLTSQQLMPLLTRYPHLKQQLEDMIVRRMG